MKLAVLKETSPGERRVALVPEGVARLRPQGLEVWVESGAGEAAHFNDALYRQSGAQVEGSRQALLQGADLILKIHPPQIQEIQQMPEGATLISLLYPTLYPQPLEALRQRRMSAFAVDCIPRTTLAQTMDVLSSQASIAGYVAVLLAARALPRFFPMMMTAAGTIPPAKVLVLGAGVAGLCAVATSRRLGASVEVFDVRRAVKEQVQSLGAKFVEVESAEDAETAGGYAKETSQEYQHQQAELIGRHIIKSDVCITTALIPDKKAPTLITQKMVQEMKPGSVVVDLAAEQGGNCELTQPNSETVAHGVTLIGWLNLPSFLATDASRTYSKNMENLLFYLLKDHRIRFDTNDEIIRGSLKTHGGKNLEGHPHAVAKP
ncbi:MAG: Re/Si-specific NAD(P)(+) transhydrogenase subunit alpha [Elusimicrobia bacterium]|nr:Re/Si-specific NAD(P)(+) transhydrogenase subunit alpha [Elusimicrobiota bacterium]